MRNIVVVLMGTLALAGCGDSGPDYTGGGEVNPGDLVVNEVSAFGVGSDWFELYNAGGTEVDLTDWSFTDDIVDRSNTSPFPTGLTVPAGGYAHVQFDATYPGFGLKGDEELGLIGPDGDVVDSANWDEGESPDGGSFARIPDGTGPFTTTSEATPGAANKP